MRKHTRRPSKPARPKITPYILHIIILMHLDSSQRGSIGDPNSSSIQLGHHLQAPEQCIQTEASTPVKTTMIPLNGLYIKSSEHHQPCPSHMLTTRVKQRNTPGISEDNGTTQKEHQLQHRSTRFSMCIPQGNIPVPSHPRLQYRDTLNHAEAKAYTCPYPGLKHGSPWSGACVRPGELPATRRPVQAYQMQRRRSPGDHLDLECRSDILHHVLETTYSPESP